MISMRNWVNGNVGPYALVVIGSLAIIAILFVIGFSIAGSYLLTIHYVHAYQASLQAAQLKQAVGTCKALHALDHAGAGIHFPAPGSGHPSELALTRLFAGIHQVYTSSGCAKIVAALAKASAHAAGR